MYGRHELRLFIMENVIIMYLSIVLDIVLGEIIIQNILKYLVVY